MKEKEIEMHSEIKGYIQVTKDDYMIVVNKNLTQEDKQQIKSYLYQRIALNII